MEKNIRKPKSPQTTKALSTIKVIQRIQNAVNKPRSDLNLTIQGIRRRTQARIASDRLASIFASAEGPPLRYKPLHNKLGNSLEFSGI